MKLKQKGLRWLKIVHLLFAISWIGGVMALVCIELGNTPDTPATAMVSAMDQLIIDEFFLIPGGIGIVATGLIYGFFSQWGFWKHNWLKVKWILTILLVIIGAGYMGVNIKTNISLLSNSIHNVEAPALYFDNVRHICIAGIFQLTFFIGIVIISVIKPWKAKRTRQQPM